MVDGKTYARYTINKTNNSAKAKVSKKILDLPDNHKSRFYGESPMDLEMVIKNHLDFCGVHKRKNQWIFTKK